MQIKKKTVTNKWLMLTQKEVEILNEAQNLIYDIICNKDSNLIIQKMRTRVACNKEPMAIARSVLSSLLNLNGEELVGTEEEE